MNFPTTDVIASGQISGDELLQQIQLALIAGADLHDTSFYQGFNILEVIIYCTSDRSIVQFLINCGAACPKMRKYQNYNFTKMMPLLINNGFMNTEIDAFGCDNNHVEIAQLAWIGLCRNIEVFREFIELGADTFTLADNKSIFRYIEMNEDTSIGYSAINELVECGLDVAPGDLKKLSQDAQLMALYKITT
jgi:hypothetical protein